MSLGTSNRDGGKTSESGHLRPLYKAFGSGVLSGLAATQRGAGANMSVDIGVGDCIIGRADLTYGHDSFNDAILNQAITTADPSNPRRDILVIYIDYGQAPSTAVSNNTNGVVKVKVVAGTPAGSPVDPTDAAIQTSVGSSNPFIKLARIRVGAAVSSISNSVIDDLRTLITPALQGKQDIDRGYVTRDHVAAGGVITGDSYGSTRAFSMTGGNVFINGKNLTFAAVAGHVVTASRDCYVDLIDNLDGTAIPVYTEVTNNNASPALAANSVRVGIVVTGASSIANVGSINQGQDSKLLPISGGYPYAINDSIGNPIKPNSPSGNRVGAYRYTGAIVYLSTSYATLMQVIGKTRGGDVNVDIDLVMNNGGSGASRTFSVQVLCDGVAINPANYTLNTLYASAEYPVFTSKLNFSHTPAPGYHTYAVQLLGSAASSSGFNPNSKVTVREN